MRLRDNPTSRYHQLPAGYPALEVPESAILAHGTADPLADAATQARLAAQAPQQESNQPPPGDWDLIHGELVTFPDPTRDLPPIDRLEGFRLGQDSLYNRVLILSRSSAGLIPAWLYIAGCRLISSGLWQRFKTDPPNVWKLTHPLAV